MVDVVVVYALAVYGVDCGALVLGLMESSGYLVVMLVRAPC